MTECERYFPNNEMQKKGYKPKPQALTFSSLILDRGKQYYKAVSKANAQD